MKFGFIGSIVAINQVKQWSNHADTDLFHLITSLPKSSQQRLLLAPRFFSLLRSKSEPGADDIDSLRQLLDLERYLCNQDGDRPRGSWTALYDFYLGPEKQVEEGAPECTSNISFRGETFKAPKLGSIVLDAFRPFTKTDFPPPMGEVTNHNSRFLTSLPSIQTDSERLPLTSRGSRKRGRRSAS